MTDQTTPDVTDDERKLARKWAESIESATNSVESTTNPWSDRARAAARVILDAVPAPPLPTLADMPREERRGCQWMQCEVNGEIRVITLIREGNDHAVTLAPSGFTFHCPPEKVTPRPDLPRLEWPGTGQDGEEATKVDYVSVAGGRTAYGPWTVARLRKKPDAVPESTLAVGSVWDDADALTRACEETGRDQIIAIDRDGDAYVWSEAAEWWESVSPMSVNAPFTILHAGKKARQ